MTKYIVGLLVLIIIIAGGYYWWSNNQPSSVTATPPAPTQSVQAATSTYATSTFSIVYPSDFTVNDAYQNTEVSPSKPISGVSFTISGSMATGTNLASDTDISVEWLPRAKQCTADIYLAANVQSQNWTDPNTGMVYSVASSSQGAAGNFYDETVYAIPGSSPCTAVRYFVHSTDLNNYPAGTVQQFDTNALMAAFDQIRESLTLAVPSASSGSVPAPTATQ